MIDRLLYFIDHGISICFAGATGDGKTAIANWLMSKTPDNKRKVIIEDGSPEFENLKKYKDGRLINDIISLRTCKHLGIKTIDLLDASLWLHPKYIVVSEMRSYEAYAAQETARTGHTVITTIHSNNALDAYDRMVTMAQLYPGNRLNEDKLTSLMLKAFPVIVYMKMLDDGNRRIMEIMEGEHYTRENGLKCHTLYRYNVETTEQKGKKTIVHGQHERVSGISENLQRTLLNNGAERKIVDQYAD